MTGSAFRPLAGIRVLDFTRVLSGPYATMQLAELGADVVKVEMPGTGDETRAWGPPFVDESSAYFHAVNQGKRSMVLDLADPGTRETAEELIRRSDVVVENFRPGVADRLGIGPRRVAELAPHVVYASISGFGSNGPMAGHAGTEVVVEAESGLMSITGLPGGEPVRFGVAMIDIATGLSAVNGLLAALVERSRTGRGRHVEVSLYATAVSAMGTLIASESAGGGAPRAWGSAHPSIVPYRAFSTRDGHLVVGATNDAMFTRLTKALDLQAELSRPEWAGNAGRVAGRDAIEDVLGRALAVMHSADALGRLRDHGVLAAPVLGVGEAARSAQTAALGLVTEDDGLLLARSPLSANGTRRLGRAPALGGHTDEILAELTEDSHASQ
ncbi:CaiB/BaiF CoA-transferase family protein [Amycolatopsis endophytica]|uniref:Crotonobetainyl-CoA:carnitine CoA-transferase CaiB-like acyl-CoA transferase n=1 Tax=Amycolatopsis endophytica TaxID=860233 RepID=A0A853BD68_9PSEU|nr:CoA transferase [Amycolatopsis endophytica]NYI93169.1 crotonobetainyl-CoA:carnitine CoA-transferase CaiB-like acyl-CoA transferase [Amycolatopsis endophytica]